MEQGFCEREADRHSQRPPFDLMELSFPSDGREAVKEVRLPSGTRIPAPEMGLPLPARLRETAGLRRSAGGVIAGGDKFSRDLFFGLIHGFRAAHGAPASDLMGSREYRAVLRRYLRMQAPRGEREAIDLISSADGFLVLYSAGGRMRHAFNPFSKKQLGFLRAEARAALTWREQFS